MQIKHRENSGPAISLQKVRIVSDTAVVTLVIRLAFIRESTKQMYCSGQVHRICFITATVTVTFTVTVTVTVTETILRFTEICCYLKYFQPTSENFHSDVTAQSI